MNIGSIDIHLSIIAATLAVASFCGEVWRLWRDRPRLTFYVTPVKFTNVPGAGELDLVRIMICNVGYRPIVLTRFMALGDRSCFSMGTNDNPAAMFGQEDQRFPALLGPGETLKIHPFRVKDLEQNATKPDGEKTLFDPYRYFVIIDSFRRIHSMDADEVRWRLRLSTKFVRPKRWKKLWRWITKKRFTRKAKTHFARDFSE